MTTKSLETDDDIDELEALEVEAKEFTKVRPFPAPPLPPSLPSHWPLFW